MKNNTLFLFVALTIFILLNLSTLKQAITETTIVPPPSQIVSLKYKYVDIDM